MRLAVLLIVASVPLMSAATALAQARTELIPSLSLSTVYDDNLFARIEGSAGRILQLRPSVEASHESATVRLLGLYSFDIHRGLTSELTSGVVRATGRVRLALDYWHGETIVLGIPGPVGVDSVTSRATWPVTRRIELGTHAGVSGVSTLDSRESTIYRGTLVGSWSPGGRYSIAASYGLDLQRGSLRTATVLDDAIGPFDDRVMRQVVRVSMTVAPRYRRSILPLDEAARAKGVTR